MAQLDTLTVDNGQAVVSPVPTIRYQYREHLGSSVIEANEHGQVISYEEFYPYGSSAYRAAASGVDLSLKRYRFTGKERDEETGLDYFGVRYYASWLGRWTAGDPGGFVDGLNLYRYVRNNPVNGIDREGYSTEDMEKPKPPPVKENNKEVYTNPSQNHIENENSQEDYGIVPIKTNAIKRKKRIVIKKKLIFYGYNEGDTLEKREGATAEQNKASALRQNRKLARQIARKVRSDWNRPKGRITIDGKKYRVRFRIKGEYDNSSEGEIKKRITLNDDPVNSFVRLNDRSVSKTSYFSNGGRWSIPQLKAYDFSTASHEFGHMLGWRYLKKDIPEGEEKWRTSIHDIILSIMASGSKFMHQNLTKNSPTNYGLPPYSDKYLNKYGYVKLSTRIVTISDIQRIANTWSSEGLDMSTKKFIFGQVENDYWDKNDDRTDGIIIINNINPTSDGGKY